MDCTTCKRMFSGRAAVLARTDSATCPSPEDPAIWLTRSSAVLFDSFAGGTCSNGLPCSTAGAIFGVTGTSGGAALSVVRAFPVALEATGSGRGADGCFTWVGWTAAGVACTASTRGGATKASCAADTTAGGWSGSKARVVLAGFAPSVNHDVEVSAGASGFIATASVTSKTPASLGNDC